MRVKSVHLRNFRRFTDLTVEGMPESARLIVLAGPNGVGKSSFFDGLQTWYQLAAWHSGHGTSEYGSKVGSDDPSEWYQRATVELHGPAREYSELQLMNVYFRTAYRHEVEFHVQHLAQQPSPTESGGIARRAVDIDQSVSENYQRLLWQTFSAVFDETTPESATKAEIRDRLTGRLAEALLRVFPDLFLTKVGGLGQGHAFEFRKGNSSGFPYVNLSAGEKAVFDLLLDAVIKSEFYKDAIWLIDEPEIHVGTRVQGRLLRELLALIPDSAQLFLASHSIGLMSEAVRMATSTPSEIIFLDFGGHDFDEPVTISPEPATREFWKKTLSVALDDLATLVAPATVVMCEGAGDGFDARCYRAIFSKGHPETDFVSVGNSHDAQTDRLGLTSALQTVAEGTTLLRLRDRDLATDMEVAAWRIDGVRVLTRRHIESYLYDEEVLEALCRSVQQPEAMDDVLHIRTKKIHDLAEKGKDVDDIKAASGSIYVEIRKRLRITSSGTTARAFAESYLAPLIRPGMAVYDQLELDIFGS